MATLFDDDPSDAMPVDAAADAEVSHGLVPPLAVRMRPQSLAEIVGQKSVVGAGTPLAQLAAGVDRADGAAAVAGPASVIVWGPPGTGKTTVAYVVSRGAGRRLRELSAVTSGVKEVRGVIEEARQIQAHGGRQTVLFLDEIHRFTKAQQDALLPAVENGWIILVAATTENPSFSVVSALTSRSLVVQLQPLAAEEIGQLLDRAVAAPRGLAGAVRLDPGARDHLVAVAAGDARRALTALEAAAGAVLAQSQSASNAGGALITTELVERVVDRAAVRYDRAGDQHYDVTSAFIKSMRGSDVDAAVHYLARMLEAGEDPRFVARRVMIAASEDVGLADPTALVVATAAAQAVALIGMPEARIILAQAVIHVASAPKSNAAYLAINAAVADVRAGKLDPVPEHLRDSHDARAAAVGHGSGYLYPHDDPRGVLTQSYSPDSVANARYYEPTDHGNERAIAERLTRIRAIVKGSNQS